MGRTRKRLPLRRETVSALVKAVSQDFANRQMEAGARALVPARGERLPQTTPHLQAIRVEHQRLLQGPKRDRVLAERERLRAELRRPRGQPRKYPLLDLAMVGAVARGESPAFVVDAAISALRVAYPDLPALRSLRLRFLERLKKKRRAFVD